MKRINLYRKVAVFGLMIAILLQSLSQVLIMGDYYINTSKYVALCVNKNKIEMHCNGQCQMAHKMEQESDSNQSNPQTNPVAPIVYFISDFATIEILIPVNIEKTEFPTIQETAISRESQDIFRPPITA